MKFTALILSLILVMVSVCLPAECQPTPRVVQQTLPNGLRVLLLEDHSYPVVSCFTWYKVGSRNETPGATGLCHLVEHMLFHNIGGFRKGELGATIVRNGGQFNGFTSDDFTAFFETVSPTKLDLMLRVEADRMRRATFTAQDLKDEVMRIKQDIDEQSKDVQAVLSREVRSAAFSQHPYKNPSIGFKPDLENFTLQDVKAFYDKYYHPENATLVIVGDINAAAVSQAVTKYFAPIPKSPNPIPQLRAVEPTQQAEKRVLMHFSSGKRDFVEVAYHAPAFADADAPAVVVLEKLLNAHLSGRLKKLIETKTAISAKSTYELKRDPGLFTVSFSIQPGTMQKLLDGWDNAVSQIKSQGASDSELRRARNLAEFSYGIENDGPYRTAFNLGFCDSLHTWQLANSWSDKLRVVTNADIQRVAKKYFAPENRVVGLLSIQRPQSPPSKVAPAADSEPEQQRHEPHPKHELRNHVTGYKQDDWSVPKTVAQKSSTQLNAPINGALKMPPRSEPAGTARSTSTSGAGQPRPSGAAGAATNSAPPGAGGGAGAPKPAPIKPLVLEPTPTRVEERVLKNGLTVLVVESHLSPVVQVVGVVRAGTAFEPPNKKGISDVMAACMNNGTTKYNHQQLQQLQEDFGLPPYAMLQFESGLQTINFKTRCMARDISSTLTTLSTCLREPLIQGSDLDKAKRDVLSLFKQIDDTPSIKTERALLRSLIATNSPYYPDDLNQKATSIATFKSSDVDDFHGENVLPEATTIVVVGDVSPELVFRLAEQTFGSWEQNTSTAKNYPPMEFNQRRIVKTSIPIKDKAKTSVSIGRLVDTPPDSANYALLLMADCVLTNHPIFSRLAQRVGADPALADNLSPDSIDTRFVPLGNTVAWALNIPVEPNIVPTVAAIVQNELRKFARTGVTPEEFAEVKRFLVNAVPVRQFSSAADAAKTVLECYIQSGGHDAFNEEVNNMRAAKVDNLNKFVRSILKPDQSSLVIAGTTATMKRVHGGKSASGPEAREAVPATDARVSPTPSMPAQN